MKIVYRREDSEERAIPIPAYQNQAHSARGNMYVTTLALAHLVFRLKRPCLTLSLELTGRMICDTQEASRPHTSPW